MTTPKQPNSRRNLDAAISRLATGTEEVRRIRLALANTIVSQMLPKGVVKGGSALKLRYGNDATRFTRDLDAARADDLEPFIAELRRRLEQGWNGFTGIVIRREPAKPAGVPRSYVMQPFEVKLSYCGKSWLTVPLEIGYNELGDASNPEYGIAQDIVELFTSLGFPEPAPVALMPLHFQIAQKLHGASESESDRAHDLIDLQIIASSSDLDYAKIKATCERVFHYRNMQTWPPLIRKNEDWENLYASQSANVAVLASVDGAIAWANDLIKKINSAN